MQAGLMDIVKKRLDYTWLDEATEKKLALIVENSIADLDSKSGIQNDYTKPGKAQSLLFQRIMYERDNALDDFYINYKKEIVAFINKAKVDKYTSEVETDAEE